MQIVTLNSFSAAHRRKIYNRINIQWRSVMRLENYIDEEYPRFEFPGFIAKGQCFLRFRIANGAIVVLCAQLINYRGTSVTNAVEHIFRELVLKLIQTGKVEKIVQKKFSERILGGGFIQRATVEIARRVSWIEHYPHETGIWNEPSYAIVRFDSRLSPVWNYVDKEFAAKQAGVDPEFLSVDTWKLKL